MAHVAIAVPPLLGHLNPMLAIADSLAARGHRITVLATGDVRRTVEAGGHAFDLVGDGSSRMPEISARPGGLIPGASMVALVLEMARTAGIMAEGLPGRLSALKADLLLADQLEPGAGLAARILKLPHLSVANALPLNRDAGVPPYFSDWRPDASRWGQERDRGAFRVYDLVLTPLNRVLRDIAHRHGITGISIGEDCLADTTLAQITTGFDFPRGETSIVACGPFRSGERPVAAVEPDQRRLVFVSFGTLLGHRFDLFSAVAQACRDLRLDCMIAHGGRLTPDQVTSLSHLARVEPFVDQQRVLGQAALAVTHAGMNTAMDIVRAGLPCLAMPFAYDQPGVAARVTHAGTGLRLSPGRATRRRIREALERLLGDKTVAARCAALAHDAQRAGGAERAADVIEARLSST